MREFEIVASNIQGQGALEVIASLLPALERARCPARIWLPAVGPLRDYASVTGSPLTRVRRRLPNALSRVVECVASSSFYRGSADRLVLGDLPLRVAGRQVVFVHNTFVLAGRSSPDRVQSLKAVISRLLFRLNQRYVHRAVVQTSIMAEGLGHTYPDLRGRIAVVPQPAPQWLLAGGVQRTGRVSDSPELRLFYPAANYRHKNHALLWRWRAFEAGRDIRLDVTLAAEDLPSGLTGVAAHGRLQPQAMVDQYAQADALVFPSLEESYGLPLVEALFLDLPILVADLPYARALCGEAAIYFDPRSPSSLTDAVRDLRQRLAAGWWPDYTPLREAFPRDWDEVAQRMVRQFDE
jgi:glycosyltransferase involved in cell wall biosynthesis